MASGSGKPPNTLHVLDNGDSPTNKGARPKVKEVASSSSGRPGSAGVEGRRALPLNRVDSATRRTPTPTKQISIQTVQRKKTDSTLDETNFTVGSGTKSNSLKDGQQKKAPTILSNSSAASISSGKTESSLSSSTLTSSVSTCSSASLESSLSALTLKSSPSSRKSSSGKERSTSSSSQLSSASTETSSTSTLVSDPFSSQSDLAPLTARKAWGEENESEEVSILTKHAKGDEELASHSKENQSASNSSSGKEEVVDIEDSDAFDTDLSDGDESSSDTSVEEVKAPTQLLMEFLSAVMEKDYDTAEKLCKMILMYEPKNPEALAFETLIAEKKELGESEESSEEEDSEDDSDEYASGSGSDSESDESESDDDQEDDDGTKPDSGVASASEQGD